MKTKLFITALLSIAFFISCNKPENDTENMLYAKEPDYQKTDQNEKQQIPVGKFSPLATDSTGSPLQTTPANADWDSKIIKTASLKVEIKDFKKYNDYVHNTVKQFGAYVAQEEQSMSDEKNETTITIKVPVTQFENMMIKLPDDGKVMEKKINTDDVTGEVVDTKSRLEAKKQMRLKYLEFLRQSKNISEVLQVQNEIDNIQMQIESAASRISFLSNKSAYSTINLVFYQPMEGYSPTDETPSFLTRLTAAFKGGTAFIGDLLIGLMSIWPLLIIMIGLFMGWKIWRKPNAIAQKLNIVDQNRNPADLKI